MEIVDLGPRLTCHAHPDRLARYRCDGCDKPLCPGCVLPSSERSFCAACAPAEAPAAAAAQADSAGRGEAAPRPPLGRPAMLRALRVWGRSLHLVLPLVVVFQAPFRWLVRFYDLEPSSPSDTSGMLRLVGLSSIWEVTVGTLLFTILLIRFSGCDGAAQGGRPPLSSALRLYPRAFTTNFLATLAILIGLALFIIPGVYATVSFCLALPAVVFEGLANRSAIERSSALVKGRRLDILLLLVLVGLVSHLAAVGADALATEAVWATVLADALADAIGVLPVAVAYAIFRELKGTMG